jgi:hypothetical protein
LKVRQFSKKKKHRRNSTLFSKPMILYNKIMVVMQARHLVHKLIPPGWQYEQACSVCTDLFNHAIYGIYEGFYQVVLDFIWAVNYCDLVFFTVLAVSL